MVSINNRSLAWSLLFFIFMVLFALGITIALSSKSTKPTSTSTSERDIPFTTYNPPKIPDKKVYKVLLVGDSMTHALGPYGGRLLDWTQEKFKGKGFIFANYSYSTNVLSLPKFLNEETKTWDVTFPPILSTDFDVLVIESFGYNPLSDHPLEEGLRLQTAMLEQTMKELIKNKPNSLVVFMATIAPSATHYGQKTQQLTAQGKIAAVNERVAYIKNHITYAQSHNIPLVNVFEKSLLPNGDGNLKYISVDDYIHPSIDGIELICERITNVLYESGLVPH